MKRAFTLVEMLVVVAILATLMSIAFRLGSAAEQDSARTKTVVKLQKIENCLSGYYAVFGSYPPVAVHGWRSIYHKWNSDEGAQEAGTAGGALVWNQIEACCRSQPFDCSFPYRTADAKKVEMVMEEVKERINNPAEFPNYSNKSCISEDDQAKISSGVGICSASQLASDREESSWPQAKVFKFGLMSYLLPRLLVMTRGDSGFYGGNGDPFAQWSDNNDKPHDPFTGDEMTYSDVWTCMNQDKDQTTSAARKRQSRVANIPSQVACARWLPNLEDMCASRGFEAVKLYGVTVSTATLTPGEDYPPQFHIMRSKSGSGGNYILNGVTINDGWGREFYYYSPPPYQTYEIWSAGPNGKTFPPWIPIKDIANQKVTGAWYQSKELTVAECVQDDILKMKN